MSFDSNSLKRLQELRPKLPKNIDLQNNSSKSKQRENSNLHIIETEENPQKLFKELIKASTNGEIPTHLINRLKALEAKESEKGTKVKNKLRKHIDENELYISFRQLLFDEEQA